MSLRRLTERKFCLDWREGRHSSEQQSLEAGHRSRGVTFVVKLVIYAGIAIKEKNTLPNYNIKDLALLKVAVLTLTHQTMWGIFSISGAGISTNG